MVRMFQCSFDENTGLDYVTVSIVMVILCRNQTYSHLLPTEASSTQRSAQAKFKNALSTIAIIDLALWGL